MRPLKWVRMLTLHKDLILIGHHESAELFRVKIYLSVTGTRLVIMLGYLAYKLSSLFSQWPTQLILAMNDFPVRVSSTFHLILLTIDFLSLAHVFSSGRQMDRFNMQLSNSWIAFPTWVSSRILPFEFKLRRLPPLGNSNIGVENRGQIGQNCHFTVSA